MVDHEAIRLRFATLDPVLDERGRRRFAAAEALAAGRGGVTAVSRITGIARSTIGRGLAELRGGATTEPDRVRRAGGGRKPLTDTDPTLLDDLRALVEPTTRGDPEAPLLWTARACATWRRLAGTRPRIGHNVVAELLRTLGYSLQANRKTREGATIPIAMRSSATSTIGEGSTCGGRAGDLGRHQEEGIGRRLQERRPRVAAEGRTRAGARPRLRHPELGRAVPYGVYDIADNAGWVSVGIDHDTASFAVNAIRRWWQTMGQARYPEPSVC